MLYLQERIINVLNSTSKGKVGFVSGPIFSINPIDTVLNILRMKSVQKESKKEFSYPVYSAIDFFTPIFFIDYLIMEVKGGTPHGMTLWVDVIESGVITDIFMCKGWEKSKGANEEYLTAKKLGLKIHLDK